MIGEQMNIWLQFIIVTGYIFFSGMMIGSPLKKNYSTARSTINSLKYTCIANLNIDTLRILDENKKSILNGIFLDIAGTHTLSTIFLITSLVAMKKIFSGLYLVFPFRFPWFIIDFPPFGMVDRLGWISLSIIMSYVWSISYSKIRRLNTGGNQYGSYW